LAALLVGIAGPLWGKTLEDYNREGIQRYDRSDFKGALQAWERGLQLAQQLSDKLSMSVFLTKIAGIYAFGGDYSRAHIHLEQALQYAREAEHTQVEAYILNSLASIHKDMGDYSWALTAHEQALFLFRNIGDRHGEAASLTHLGNIYREVGEYAQSRAAYEQALLLLRDLGERREEPGALSGLGTLYNSVGDYTNALTTHEQALLLFRALGNRQGEASTLTALGNVYQKVGDYARALTTHEQALLLFRTLGDRLGEGVALGNLGLVHRKSGNSAQARPAFEQALQLFQALGVAPKIKQAEANIGEVYLEQGEVQQALKIFKKLNAPMQLGRYYLHERAYQRAREEFTKGLRAAEEQRNADLLVASHIGLGLALEGVGEHSSARAVYEKAVEFIEQQRESLVEPQRRRFFAAKVMGFSRLEPYEGLSRVHAALQEDEESLFWAEHTKARLLLEAVAQRSLNNRLRLPADLAKQEGDLITRIATTSKQLQGAFEQKNTERYQALAQELAALKQEQTALIARLRRAYPAYVTLRYPVPIKVTQLRLQPDEALLAYEVTESATFVWLIKGTTVLKTHTIPVSRRALTAQVK
jgi:tetratricopeptide (TPR) repeat protein